MKKSINAPLSLEQATVLAMMLNEKKKPKPSAKAQNKARIQNAVYGFVIPMLKIPALYKQLEAGVAAGASDAELKAIVAAFPGVEPADDPLDDFNYVGSRHHY